MPGNSCEAAASMVKFVGGGKRGTLARASSFATVPRGGASGALHRQRAERWRFHSHFSDSPRD
jgi:hypothetical protein